MVVTKHSIPRVWMIFDLGLHDDPNFVNRMKLKSPQYVDYLYTEDCDIIQRFRKGFKDLEVYDHGEFTVIIK